jgi:hypothetical protein
MDELVQFLRARYDEDAALAEEARGQLNGRWTYIETRGGDHKVVDSLGYTVTGHYDVDAQPFFCEPHIVRHDPARVLRDIEARRRLVSLHAKDKDHDGCTICDNGNNSCGCMSGWYWKYPCDTLKILALPYADHPDYRAEWRP